jgi:hypothetical protein
MSRRKIPANCPIESLRLGSSGCGADYVIQRENVRKGLLVRLLKDYLDVPAGTKATVDDIGTLSSDWWFTNVSKALLKRLGVSNGFPGSLLNSDVYERGSPSIDSKR